MKDICIYFESWASKWVSSATAMDLATIVSPVTIVNIAFVQPATNYTLGQKTWSNTGLQFSQDFSVVQQAIAILRGRGIKVLLSVGGSTYPFAGYNAKACASLCSDLGCDGLDLDWEPSTGAGSDTEFGPIIDAFSKALGPGKSLSAACFSVGAYQKDGSTYKGMNIKGINTNGSQLSWINIMAYDAGSLSDYDPIVALMAYRMIYKGPLLLGFEVGTQGWGGALLTESDVVRSTTEVARDPNNGIFVWSWLQTPHNTPTPARVVEICKGILGTSSPVVTVTPPTPVVTTPPVTLGNVSCPNCKKSLVLTLS